MSSEEKEDVKEEGEYENKIIEDANDKYNIET